MTSLLIPAIDWVHPLIDRSVDILYVLDLSECRLIYLNSACEQILGYSSHNLLTLHHQTWEILFHREDRILLSEHHQALLTLPDRQVLEIECRIQDIEGHWRWLAFKHQILERTAVGVPLRIMGTAQDITHYKEIQFKLKRQQEGNSLVNAIAQRIYQFHTLPSILQTTVEEVRQFLQTDRVMVYRFNHDWSGFIQVESVEPGWKSLLGITLFDEEFAAHFIPNYCEGRIHAVADIFSGGLSDCHVEWLQQLQVRANLVIPIVQNDKLWGLLVAQHCSAARWWEDWEIDLLRQLAIHVSIAIEQAVLYQGLKEANKKLRRLAFVDALTQIANRGSFNNSLNREWRRMEREKQFLSIILCDIDFFKDYNDYYGHPMGDDCLYQVARILAKSIDRPGDVVARYGGEEFAFILPNTSLEGAVYVANKIRSQLRQCQIPHDASKVGQFLTMSFGVASCIPEIDQDPRSLINQADRALYLSKRRGRDRISPDGQEKSSSFFSRKPFFVKVWRRFLNLRQKLRFK